MAAPVTGNGATDVWQTLVDIIAAPTTAFTRLRQAPTFWLPLVLLLVVTVGSQLGYFLHNDAGFVRDEIAQQALASGNVTREQARQIEATYAKIPIAYLASISSVSVLILVPVIMCLYAWYLGFMARFSFSELGFRHWLALQCWSSVPTLFAGLAVALVLLGNDNGQVSQSELQPLSVAGLLGIKLRSPTLQQFNVLQIWSSALTIIGFRQWAGGSWQKSALIVLAPSFLIYGAIAYFS